MKDVIAFVYADNAIFWTRALLERLAVEAPEAREIEQKFVKIRESLEDGGINNEQSKDGNS